MKYRFLFVGAMILGKNTAFRNLRDAVSAMGDVESTWVAIEMEPDHVIARIPPVSWNHSLMFGLVARLRVRALERSGKVFDAAFFNHILPAVSLRRFRRRVPSVDSMDTTPIGLLQHGQAYYVQPRSGGARLVREVKDRFARSIFAEAAYCLPYSNFTKRSLIDDYRIPEEKIIVVAPGVNVDMWPGRPPEDGGSSVRKSPVRVLFVGGDFLRKGGDLLVDVARREEFSQCEFHFVTRSFGNDRPANVVVHDDVTANSRAMLELYRAADIFVLPTRADFGPTNSVCEAMAMGLPVIATGVGGLDEIVREGKTGFIVPLNDADAVAGRLRTLVADPELRASLGRNARQLVETEFNVMKNAQIIVDCLKRAAGRRQGVPVPLTTR